MITTLVNLRRFLPLATASFCLPFAAVANAELDWAGAPDVAEADRLIIQELARRVNLETAAVETRPGMGGSWYLIRSAGAEDGLKRVWRQFGVCHTSVSFCSPRHFGMGEWLIISQPSFEERWHFTDGDWSVDVELGGAVSYADAERIILAIHRNELRTTPDYQDGISFDASTIKSITAIDPIQREFTVALGDEHSGYDLQVRLQDDGVLLYALSMWIASAPPYKPPSKALASPKV